jgi:hypothetical protein
MTWAMVGNNEIFSCFRRRRRPRAPTRAGPHIRSQPVSLNCLHGRWWRLGSPDRDGSVGVRGAFAFPVTSESGFEQDGWVEVHRLVAANAALGGGVVFGICALVGLRRRSPRDPWSDGFRWFRPIVGL